MHLNGLNIAAELRSTFHALHKLANSTAASPSVVTQTYRSVEEGLACQSPTLAEETQAKAVPIRRAIEDFGQVVVAREVREDLNQ